MKRRRNKIKEKKVCVSKSSGLISKVIMLPPCAHLINCRLINDISSSAAEHGNNPE